MCGFLLGTLFVMMLFGMKAFAFRHRRYHGWSHDHWHGRHGRRERRGRGRGFARFASVELLKRRLDLDEDQGDLAEHAVADAQRSLKAMTGSLRDGRDELADLVRGETIDDARLEVIFDRLDDDLARTRRELVSAVKQIHATLDAEQREQLAAMLAGDRGAR